MPRSRSTHRLTDICPKCGHEYGAHDGSKCPRRRPPSSLASSPAAPTSPAAPRARRRASPAAPTSPAAPSSPAPAPAPVEVHHLAHVTYQLRFVRCGKARCDRWHGPYWYAFYRDSSPIGTAGARKAGKTRCTYIGRTLPAELAAALGRGEVDSAAEDSDL